MNYILSLLNQSTITVLGLVILCGIVFGKIINKLKLPHVTGYIIGGIIIGPYVLKIISQENIDALGILNDVALGFIAFSIGSEFKKERLKQAGWKIIVITVCEAYVASIVTFVGLYYLAHQTFEFSLMAAAIASATAPAATIMVVKQYKARGLFVETLLQVVALDDAAAIIAFAIAIAVSQATLSNSGVSAMAFIQPLIEIFGAAILGAVVGYLLSVVNNRAKTNETVYAYTMFTVLFTVGIANALNVSPLIACMISGSVVINTSKNFRPFALMEGFTGPLFMAFFVLAGLDLNITVLASVGIFGVIYVVFRAAGKILGAGIGSRICNYPKNIVNWLGVALIPQAGVALGLSALAEKTLMPVYPQLAVELRTMILASTVIYELLGPVLAKIALTRAKTLPSLDKAESEVVNATLQTAESK